MEQEDKMSYSSLLDNKEVLIGTILNIERKEKGLSLSDLTTVGKSIQYISDIENGNKKIYKPTVSKLFSLIGIEFDFDENLLLEVNQLFDQLIHIYLSVNRTERKICMEKLTSNPAWEFSYAYPIIQLTKYMATVLGDINFSYDYINQKCEKLFSLYTNRQKSIYLLMKAINEYYNMGNLDLAKNCLQSSISYSPEDAITGFSYNQLGNLMSLDFNITKSLEYQRKGIELLAKHQYYQRTFFLELMIGNHLGTLRRFKDMKEQFLKTYEFAVTYNIENLKYKTLYNLAYYSMYGKIYEDAINYAFKVIEMDKYKTECYYILSWTYMELGNITKADEYYHLLVKSNKHDDYIIDGYEKCLKWRLKGKESSYYKALKDLYGKLLKKGNAFDQVMVLEYIIEYCDQHLLYEEGYIYQKNLLKILQKNY